MSADPTQSVENRRAISRGWAEKMLPFAALTIALRLTAPAVAHEDLDGSYNNLALAYQGKVAAYITDRLRDPKSAQFRLLRIVDHGAGRVTVCGEVNARNGYGGYNGFEPFALTSYPNGKTTHYVTALFIPEMRPVIRRSIV